MAAINQRIREAAPVPPRQRERLIEQEGEWQVEHCLTSTRYECRVEGLQVRVVDYEATVYWQVLGVLADIDLTATGHERPDWREPGDGLRLAKAAACGAAQFLHERGVEPRPNDRQLPLAEQTGTA